MRTHLAATIGLAVVLTVVPALAQEIDVRVEGDRMSLEVGQAPLAEVLRAVGEAGGFEVKLEGDLGEVQPQRFQDLPLGRAIRRLTGDHGVIMAYADDGTLESVRVHAATLIGASPEEREAARKRAAEQRQAVLARVRSPATPESPEGGGGSADADQAERFARVRELARQGGPDSLPSLGDVLSGDPDPALRRAAAAAIGSVGGPEAAQLLQGALADDDASVRMQALRGLRGADPAIALNAYGDIVQRDPDPAVRRAAVDLAAGLGTDGAEVLEIALDDDDDRVRQAAERAIERIE
jgi:hypothetical protein